MIRSVIISGPPAVGKTTIAKGIAEEFGLTHLSGGDILKEIAEEQGFKTGGDDWWDTQEGMNFLSQRQENSEFDKKVDDKALYGFEFGEDLSLFDKIIETDGLNASQVLDIAKTVVRKLF